MGVQNRSPVDCFAFVFIGRCVQSDEYHEHGDDVSECNPYSGRHVVEWQAKKGQAQCEGSQSTETGETVVQILVSPGLFAFALKRPSKLLPFLAGAT